MSIFHDQRPAPRPRTTDQEALINRRVLIVGILAIAAWTSLMAMGLPDACEAVLDCIIRR